jgi:hypothetical protein
MRDDNIAIVRNSEQKTTPCKLQTEIDKSSNRLPGQYVTTAGPHRLLPGMHPDGQSAAAAAQHTAAADWLALPHRDGDDPQFFARLPDIHAPGGRHQLGAPLSALDYLVRNMARSSISLWPLDSHNRNPVNFADSSFNVLD